MFTPTYKCTFTQRGHINFMLFHCFDFFSLALFTSSMANGVCDTSIAGIHRTCINFLGVWQYFYTNSLSQSISRASRFESELHKKKNHDTTRISNYNVKGRMETKILYTPKYHWLISRWENSRWDNSNKRNGMWIHRGIVFRSLIHVAVVLCGTKKMQPKDIDFAHIISLSK